MKLLSHRLAIAALFSIAAANSSLAAIEYATITGGRVQGEVKDGLASFKGLPFAAPPVGALRWKIPQPVIDWSGVRKSDTFAPACIQPWTGNPDPNLRTKPVEFHKLVGMGQDLSIRNFAWSPDGRRFALRVEADSKCNYAAIGFKRQTGHFPCIYSRNLIVVDVDGSHLTKVTPTPDFDSGELFWIQ